MDRDASRDEIDRLIAEIEKARKEMTDEEKRAWLTWLLAVWRKALKDAEQIARPDRG